MSNTNKVLIGLGVLALLILIYKWNDWFGNKSTNSSSTTNVGTGTGRNTNANAERVISSRPIPTPNGGVKTQVGCAGKGFYTCTSQPTDCSDATLAVFGCKSE